MSATLIGNNVTMKINGGVSGSGNFTVPSNEYWIVTFSNVGTGSTLGGGTITANVSYHIGAGVAFVAGTGSPAYVGVKFTNSP